MTTIFPREILSRMGERDITTFQISAREAVRFWWKGRAGEARGAVALEAGLHGRWFNLGLFWGFPGVPR
jgi:hypothetical protein